MSSAPDEVIDLAERRRQARLDRDFGLSDDLRDRISELGWIVTDTPDGFTLVARPPYPTLASVDGLADQVVQVESRAAVGLVVDGWADDVRTCVAALVDHSDAVVLLLDNGSDAGTAVHELAQRWPDRVREFHLERPVGWSAATTALLHAHDAAVHVSMDVSSVLDGDAISPLCAAIRGDVVAAGWQGADVDLEDSWRSVVAAGPGEVDVLLGYLMAVDRSAAIATPPHPKATFYRNADLEWSLRLRAAGGRLVVPSADLPVHQERHRGYHDSDPAVRDKASKKTYDRILADFRGRTQILRPRAGDVVQTAGQDD